MITATIVALILVAMAVWGPVLVGRETPKEKYGLPPGMMRALDPREIPDDRGWPGMDKVFEGSSASSIANMIERRA